MAAYLSEDHEADVRWHTTIQADGGMEKREKLISFEQEITEMLSKL